MAGILPVSSGERVYHQQLDIKNDIEWVSADSQAILQAHDKRFDDSETREDAHDTGSTVKEIIFAKQAVNQKTLKLISQFDMSQHLDKGIRFISSGQIRKTLLLKAYIKKAKIIIIDDPLIGLDSKSQTQVKTLIKTLAAADYCTVILLLRRKQDMVEGMSHFAQLDNCVITQTGLIKSSLPSFNNTQTPYNKAFDLTLDRAPIKKGTTLIKLNKVNAHYRDKYVFKDQDFSLRSGEHIAISGPNGSGKSTLINLLTGDNHMAYGQDVWLFGKKRGSGESVWSIKRQFGIISNTLHEQHSKHSQAEDVVISGLYDTIGLYDKPSSSDRQKASICLQFLGIEHLKQKSFKQISYGQQRLTLLARAIIKQPPIILLDEAFTGLDDEHKTNFVNCLHLLTTNTDITLVNISHMQDEQLDFIHKSWAFVADENNSGLHKLIVSQN